MNIFKVKTSPDPDGFRRKKSSLRKYLRSRQGSMDHYDVVILSINGKKFPLNFSKPGKLSQKKL